ncbi:MAG: hypothetical protein DCF15_12450 [Phormidesmis priestleyi]|uniref:Uncharacterized protein n=1 Tax=Phormidesmis priestleyi TaxID=268141 RepID=A0A2W4X9R2_9CYAN|nr:MAG: hypothetical protein DCF15_12450 [Phormidesmis priestleyi]
MASQKLSFTFQGKQYFEGDLLPLPQFDPLRPPHETLPTMYDLPSDFPVLKNLLLVRFSG